MIRGSKREKFDSLVVSMALGLRRPTYIERIFTFLHIPYVLGCLLLATIFGPPGAILSAYVYSNNLNEAVSRAIFLFYGVYPPLWGGVAGLSVLYALFFYLLYMIRFMRMRLVATEPLFLSFLPKDEETVHKIFSGVSRVIPPIVIGSLFSVVLSLTTEDFVNFITFCCDMASTVYLTVALPFFCIVFSSFVWVYCSSIRGLHELGKRPLKLRSFYEDRLLGLKPIGSLSLYFASTFFGGMGLIALFPVLGSPYVVNLFYLGILFIIAILGVVFFILPLFTFHNRMVEVKKREQEALQEQFSKAMIKQSESSSQVTASSASDTEERLDRLTKIVVSDITKREIDEMTTWPFDMPILQRLLASIVSVNVIVFLADLAVRLLMNSS
jgi:hypothetical protein